jgi:glutamate racemase
MLATMTRRAEDPRAPIGVFDSGVGGLTVAKEIARTLPGERIVYLADQAHVPYGGRPLEEISSFAESLAAYLFAEGAKAVVMACNISSATALERVRARFGHQRVFGMIGPGSREAIRLSANKRIGVLATLGTTRTRAYTKTLLELAPEAEAIEVACPAFVPLVEAGTLRGPDALARAHEYLAPLKARGVDTIVLGCTHYPFLIETLELAEPHASFVDPARATVVELERALFADRLLSTGPRLEPHRFLTTADPRAFAAQLRGLFDDLVDGVERIDWEEITRAR